MQAMGTGFPAKSAWNGFTVDFQADVFRFSPNMRRDLITTLLTIVLAGSCLANAVLVYQYSQTTRELDSMQSQMTAVQQKKDFMKALAADLVVYSQHNPAIDPLLQSVGLKPAGNASAPANRPVAPATAKPAKK